MIRQVDFNTRYFPVVELGLLLLTLFNNLLAQGGSSTYLVEIEGRKGVYSLNKHNQFWGSSPPSGIISYGLYPVLIDTMGNVISSSVGECPSSVNVYRGIPGGNNVLGINYYPCYNQDSFPGIGEVDKLYLFSDDLDTIGSYVSMKLYDYLIRDMQQDDSMFYALGFHFVSRTSYLLAIQLNSLFNEVGIDTICLYRYSPNLFPATVKTREKIYYAISLRDSASTSIDFSQIYCYHIRSHLFTKVVSWQNTSPADQSKFYDIVSDETRLYVAAHDTLFCYDTNGVEIWKKIPDHFVQKLTYNPFNRTIAVSAYSTGYLQDIWFYDLDGNFITHTSLASVVEGVRDSVDQVFITNIFPRPDCGWLMLGAYRDLRSGEQRTFIMRTNPWGTLDPTGFCRTPQPPATGWQLYPNPSTDHVTLEAPSGIAPWQVQVYDMAGRLVYAPNETSTHEMKLSIASWPQGVYAVVAVSETGEEILYSGRLVK